MWELGVNETDLQACLMIFVEYLWLFKQGQDILQAILSSFIY